ncbi:tRNA pseudouridine(13) synthase TruD [Salinivibrio sp. ES.052]|uniref:tRNA pseudouridine(13) synthase TruD n=1 Tax=Salinivibrio sp. ES.052 TaxID=1882823 RepID=UPI00092BB43A|nr:tRNA pseudouridine(13) synthase TruD [Salinivibrio sp. ES.052]SIO02855.1 tRNA pseudouridine13 synthase [Salinivibrio sp. ES.052]
MTDLLTPLAYLHGQPSQTGVLKSTPDDFIVSETLGFSPSGQGEHFLVRIKKRGENTKYVANELAKACGVTSRQVSWAGLKDRHAVTEQWFSVHLPGKDDPDLREFVEMHPGVVSIEGTARHQHKLRPGDLTGNQFTLCIRQLEDPQALIPRLEAIAKQGVPNYFGAQRFGRGGNNVETARAWGRGEHKVRDKNKRSFYLSAARALLFNHVVSARLEAGLFEQTLAGDLCLNEQQQIEVIDQAGQHQQHITAPLTGDNALPTTADAEQFEQRIVDQEPDLLALIRDNRMRHDRRRIVLVPQAMTWTHDAQTLTVSFFLPAGAFATAVMRELVVASQQGEHHANID